MPGFERVQKKKNKLTRPTPGNINFCPLPRSPLWSQTNFFFFLFCFILFPFTILLPFALSFSTSPFYPLVPCRRFSHTFLSRTTPPRKRHSHVLLGPHRPAQIPAASRFWLMARLPQTHSTRKAQIKTTPAFRNKLYTCIHTHIHTFIHHELFTHCAFHSGKQKETKRNETNVQNCSSGRSGCSLSPLPDQTINIRLPWVLRWLDVSRDCPYIKHVSIALVCLGCFCCNFFFVLLSGVCS